jgi:hypothetical protein
MYFFPSIIDSTMSWSGLLPPQPAFDRDTQPTAAMHPAPVPHEYDVRDRPEDFLERRPIRSTRAHPQLLKVVREKVLHRKVLS